MVEETQPDEESGLSDKGTELNRLDEFCCAWRDLSVHLDDARLAKIAFKALCATYEMKDEEPK